MSSSDEAELKPINFEEDTMFDMTYDESYQSAMINAACQGNLEKIKSLVQAGRSVNVTDNKGYTPLHHAVANANKELFDYLLSIEEINIDAPTYRGQTALIISSHRLPEFALKLIEVGADVTASDDKQMTPLHFSVQGQNPQLVHELIKKGADVDATDYAGDTPLNTAIKDGRISEYVMEIVCMLIWYDADPTLPCFYNLSPLMNAIIKEHTELARMLIEFETDFNRSTEEGMTALFLTISHRLPLVQDLIDHGVDVNHVTNFNAVQLALDMGNADVFAMIWNRIHDYTSIWTSSDIDLLRRITISSFKTFCECLITVARSDKIGEVIVNTSPEYLAVTRVVSRFVNCAERHGFFYDVVSETVCILLTWGLDVFDDDLEMVYRSYRGESELFKIMLYMRYGPPRPLLSYCQLISYMRISTHTSPETLCERLFTGMVFDDGVFPHNLRKWIQFFRGAKYSWFLRYQSLEYAENLMKQMQTMPSLLELVRNAVRVYIINAHNIQGPCKLHTLVNHMDMSQVLKDILLLKKPIYICDTV